FSGGVRQCGGGAEGMELTGSREALRQAADEARAAGATIGLVPTMGDLHRGHASLIERARRECGLVAVSIFVNPLQFDVTADLEAYPRGLDRDRATAEALGCDLLFVPDEGEMFPDGPPQVTV